MVRAHKKVKRIWGMALIMALCLWTWMGAYAQSDASDQRLLSITLGVKPGEMVSAGAATMTFVLSNPTEFDIQNVYLASSDGTFSESIGQIDAGETQTLVRSYNVTEGELDQGKVSYTVSHDPILGGDAKIVYTVEAPVGRVQALPQVDFTRQISSGYVVEGGVVVITYKVRNTGNVAIEGLRIRDELGDFTGRMEKLNIGESRSFISRVTVSAPCTSRPILEYTIPGGETVDVQLDEAAIQFSEGGVEAHFSVGESAFNTSTADAILTLSNNSNTHYMDITVLDDIYGGVIADSIDLPSGGDPVEIAYTYPIRGKSNYRWRITGMNEAGEQINFLTRTYALSENDSVEDITVSIEATASMTHINRPGYVTFNFEISNTGTDMAQDVVLYEVNRGEIRKLAVLPTGEPTRCTENYEITQSSQFIFCLNYTDENGHPRTISTSPIDISLSAGGEAPIQIGEESLNLDGKSVKMESSSRLMILLGVIGGLLVVLFVVLVITSHRVRLERRARREAERQRIREELGKTAPFKPVKSRK